MLATMPATAVEKNHKKLRKSFVHPLVVPCIVEDGYQLCASCGKTIECGETADSLDLGGGLTEYVHPKCLDTRIPIRWNKTIRVHDSRSGKNDNPAQFVANVMIGNYCLPLMTTISNEQIEAELSLVTRHSRETLKADAPSRFSEDEDEGTLELIEDTGCKWNGRNYVSGVTSQMLDVDRMGSYLQGLTRYEWAAIQKIETEIIWKERARTYAAMRTVYVDPVRIDPPFIGSIGKSGKASKKLKKDKATDLAI